MDRNRSRQVALAVLGVVAVGLVAAVAAPLFAQGPGSQASPEDPTEDTTAQPADDPVSIPFEYGLYAVFVVAAIAIAAQFVADPWGSLKGALVAVGIAAVGAGIVFVLFEFAADPSFSPAELTNPRPPSGDVPNETPTNGSALVGEGESDTALIPTDSLAAVGVVVAVIGAVVLLAWRVGVIRSALGGGSDASEESSTDLDRLGRVAGQAADDVERAATATAADNAIYRAWSEMVALLDAPDPQSGTPRQFAAAAVEAGMDPEEVDVLTRTFEEVRYGDAALSPERRERATEALRRIEATHGEDAAGDSR